MIKPYDPAFVKFLDWLLVATTIDDFEYAEWLHENYPNLVVDMEDGWSQCDVSAYLKEQFVSAHRLNTYPSSEVQS